MKASFIAQNIANCVKIYGDRDIKYMGRIKDGNGTTFFEDITTITFSDTLNGDKMTDEQLRSEPFVLLGNSTFSYKQNSMQLNWLGKLLYRLIVKKL